MSQFENTTAIVVRPLYPPRPIQFSIVLVVLIVSIPCFAFVLFHTLTNRTLYRALNNHVIILLLLLNAFQTLTDVPMRLAYYWTGILRPATVAYCIVFNFPDLYLYTTSFLLLAWASFERHILIFRAQLFNTTLRRLLGHYIPLGFCCVYPLLYYIVFFFFYPCENYYDASVGSCVTPCFLWVSSIMALYEQVAHGFAPMLLIALFNLLLVIRVLRQNRRMGRELAWRKNRKMAIQLFSISFLFFASNSGYFIVQIGRFLIDPTFGRGVAAWFFPMSICTPPLISFVCLSTIPDLKQKLLTIFRRCCPATAAVAPRSATQPTGT